MKFLKDSFVLILSFVSVFVWENTPLSDYTVQLLGALIALYLIVSARKRGREFLSMGGEGPWGVFILNTVVLLLIFSTGSLDSPLFFLLFFMCFGIAFVFEPSLVFVFALAIIIIFIPDSLKGNFVDNAIKHVSLVLISPLAYFFGKGYRKNDEQEDSIEAIKERTNDAADTISKDIEGVIKDKKQILNEKDLDKLNEVLEETEDLREESKI